MKRPRIVEAIQGEAGANAPALTIDADSLVSGLSIPADAFDSLANRGAWSKPTENEVSIESANHEVLPTL